MTDIPTITSLLKVCQAAEYLGCSERTVWSLEKKGAFSAVRMSSQLVRFDPADLDEFIRQAKGGGR